MIVQKLAYILLLLCLPIELHGQNMIGKIIDGESNDVLPGATILIPSIKLDHSLFGAVSDENGMFSISQIPIGRHLIKITYLGYKSYDTTINIASRKDTIELSIRLFTKEVLLPFPWANLLISSKVDSNLVTIVCTSYYLHDSTYHANILVLNKSQHSIYMPKNQIFGDYWEAGYYVNNIVDDNNHYRSVGEQKDWWRETTPSLISDIFAREKYIELPPNGSVQLDSINLFMKQTYWQNYQGKYPKYFSIGYFCCFPKKSVYVERDSLNSWKNVFTEEIKSIHSKVFSTPVSTKLIPFKVAP